MQILSKFWSKGKFKKIRKIDIDLNQNNRRQFFCYYEDIEIEKSSVKEV